MVYFLVGHFNPIILITIEFSVIKFVFVFFFFFKWSIVNTVEQFCGPIQLHLDMLIDLIAVARKKVEWSN